MKGDMPSQDQLVEILAAERKAKSRLYPEAVREIKNETISTDLNSKIAAFESTPDKVDLRDLPEVKRRTKIYLQACAASGTFPTVLGLSSMALGVSRQWLNEFMRKNPESPSTEFLERIKDALADTVLNAALNKQASDAVSIFLLKNTNGFSDRLEIAPAAPADPLGHEAEQRALEARLNDVVLEADDDG